MPLIFAGLAVAISFRAGMFNIGGDGQLMIGALGATIAAFALQGQVPALVILVRVDRGRGARRAAFWGFIPGFLKARTGAHEVITTIMLNYIAAQVVFFALRRRRPARSRAARPPVSKTMSTFVDVPLIIDLPAIRLDYGFVVALLMAGGRRRGSCSGRRRASSSAPSGFNLTAARYAGMSAGGSMMLAMALSGGLAGLAGGVHGRSAPSASCRSTCPAASGSTRSRSRCSPACGPSGVVLAALLFGALTTGGKLMGIQSGHPVRPARRSSWPWSSCSSPRPGLIRGDLADQGREAGAEGGALDARRLRTARAAMTTRRRDRRAVTGRSGLAARRALRDARIRGVAFAPLGAARRSTSPARASTIAATFSFWIDEQGGERRRSQTTVGVLWIVAAIVVRRSSPSLQLLRGAAFRWRPWLLLLVAPWVAAILADLLAGKPANLTGMIGGSLELAVPITLGALAGILSERSGMLNIALEGKMLVGAFIASVVVERRLARDRQRRCSATLVGIAAAMLVSGAALGLLLAWLGIRHQDGPDHRRHGDQHRRGRASRTSCSCGCCSATRSSTRRRRSSRARCRSCPTSRCSARSCSRPSRTCTSCYVIVIVLTYMIFRTRWGLRLRASGEKPAAAGTVGINVLAIRYRALLLAGPDLRPRRLVPVAGDGGQLPDGDDRRQGLHRARGGDLRRVASDRRVRGRARLRLRRTRRRRCSTSWASDVAAADPEQRPVRGHDRRRGGRRRARARARRGRPAVRAGLSCGVTDR